MEITETSLDSVNSVVNEEVFFQSTVPHAQCAALTDVLEDQIPENASKYSIFIEIVQKCISAWFFKVIQVFFFRDGYASIR